MNRKTVQHILSKMDKDIFAQSVTKDLLEIDKQVFLHNAKIINYTVDTAIKCIRQKIHHQNQANLFISSIENLENLLSKENDLKLLIKKTNALTKMLDLVVINSGTPEENIKAMENFLASMSEISEENKQKVNTYALLAAVALMVVIMGVLSSLVFPLIPITAGIAAFGLTTAALVATSIVCNGLIHIMSMFILSVPLLIIQKELTGPIGRFIQRCTNEYNAADTLGDHLLGFFSVRRIDDGLEDQALLDDADEMEHVGYVVPDSLQVN